MALLFLRLTVQAHYYIYIYVTHIARRRYFLSFQQLSQFWYSDATALVLAKEALSIAGENGRFVDWKEWTLCSNYHIVLTVDSQVMLNIVTLIKWHTPFFNFLNCINHLIKIKYFGHFNIDM